MMCNVLPEDGFGFADERKPHEGDKRDSRLEEGNAGTRVVGGAQGFVQI
jgi:hypothetical protein